jgi:hypothetical protein
MHAAKQALWAPYRAERSETPSTPGASTADAGLTRAGAASAKAI